jgi:hypothetical protein
MLAGAFSWRHLNAHRSDEYIVPEASDGDVTDAACPSMILLVEQQVSLSLYDQRLKQTHKRLSTSHHANLPKMVQQCQRMLRQLPRHAPSQVLEPSPLVGEHKDYASFL